MRKIKKESGNREQQQSWYPLGIFENPVLESVFLFYLGSAWQRLSDIGECFDTASRIDESREGSWAEEWVKTGDRLNALGHSCLQKHHRLTAGESYLRAATYYRAALHHHPDPTAPEVKQLTLKEIKNFKDAMQYLDIPVEAVEIPYERTHIPGYWFKSQVKGRKKNPVLIFHSGRDSWAEDYLWIAQQATLRGYHCLLFDGPGQGKLLRLQNLPFRYDWEKVVGPVVDFVIKDRSVDKERIALTGFSMGGFLAPRAATAEKRIKLCIANPGVLSWVDGVYTFLNQLNPELMQLFHDGAYERFDKEMAAYMETNAFFRWGIADTMWKHGARTPSEMMQMLQEYTIEDKVRQIKCRMLVIDGMGEEYSAGQARKLYDALRCPKDFILFTEEDTGFLHCQPGALSISYTRIFNWLDDHL
ncbi:alpha/beta hydrolase family protein [Taibaiella koreensis]|uniref:alpha/beta hydrolase family protein n=1 Tax=Taibaiella koreensis TaxID=1268548 RepID=UPI000E59D01E|nr:alpha/beta fold hydrolase [Taibaiella koreensis]